MAHLRSHVLWRAAGGLADRAGDLVLAVAEIADLDHRPRVTSVQQDIVQLDVSIGNAHAVAVVQPDDKLLEEPSRLLLGAAIDLCR